MTTDSLQAPSASAFDLHFCVADAAFSITFPSAAEAEDLSAAYAPFRIKASEVVSPLFHATVNKAEAFTSLPLTKASQGCLEIGEFDCGGALHSIYSLPAGGYRIMIATVNGAAACAFESDARFTDIRLTLYGDADDRSFGLNNALMIAFAFAGAYRHIVLMHAAVVELDGKGYLFLGKSGTGKSTHARLWLSEFPGSSLLNDDNPAVRIAPDGSGVIVYGTPWSGKTPCYRNASASVGAIVRLEQAPENVIVRQPAIKAFASILSSCSTMIWDGGSYNAIISTATQMATVVPTFHLRCLPNAAAAQLCRAAVV